MRYLFTLALLSLAFISCGGGAESVSINMDADTVNVVFFYGKHQCEDCKAIERVARSVVDSLDSERVVMHSVDISQNVALAKEWEAAWTALKISYRGSVVELTREGYAMAREDSKGYGELIESWVNLLIQSNGERSVPTR